MELSPEINKKIQELQIFEQNSRNILIQKQSVQVELNEILNALDELSKTHEEVYRVLGGIMVKADRETLSKELEEKKKLLELRIQSLDKQEKSINEKSSVLQSEIQKSMEKNEKPKDKE